MDRDGLAEHGAAGAEGDHRRLFLGLQHAAAEVGHVPGRIGAGPAFQLFQGKAEDAFGGGVGVEDDALGVLGDKALGHGLEKGAEAVFALGEGGGADPHGVG